MAATISAEGTASRRGIELRSFRFVDYSRVARYRNGKQGPRRLLTYVRYPGSGSGPFPLVVFGHGFMSTPTTYARLLDAWARAGYVVAAPVFPVENANAPGGPDESDLINEPTDISSVITQLLAANASPTGPLRGLIDPALIAVAGHSDGAEAALAVAYDHRFADRRIRAAVILSGAELGGRTTWFGPGTPPLLAVQGTADAINPPRYAKQFFRAAQRPKFLLELLGAGHLPPYTSDSRELTIVEHVTIAFLDHYLKQASLQGLLTAAADPGLTHLIADT
jgi:pimeloyl-ACP methyl ester carboxylesterase